MTSKSMFNGRDMAMTEARGYASLASRNTAGPQMQAARRRAVTANVERAKKYHSAGMQMLRAGI